MKSPLYNPEGEVVAREGDVIESGGGHMPVDESVSPRGCLPATGDIAAIQGQVRVVALAVPSLEGIIDVAEARTALEEAGFLVEVEYLDCAPGGFCKQGVVDTISSQGSRVSHGGVVRLRAR